MQYCLLCDEPKPLTEFAGGHKRCRPCRLTLFYEGRALIEEKRTRDDQWLDDYGHNWRAMIPNTPGDWPSDERWLPVHGYPGQYEISDHGRVRTLWQCKMGNYYRLPVPRLLKPHTMKSGYISLALTDWCVAAHDRHYVHALVAAHFIGPRPSRSHVCRHLDGRPFNNHYKNLEWGTALENWEDAVRLGHSRKGERNPSACLTDGMVIAIREERRATGASWETIAEKFGIPRRLANQVGTYRAWPHLP